MVAILSALFLAGCNTQTASNEEANNSSTHTETPVTSESTDEPSVVNFTNDDGELVCPVMGSVIESEDKAVGHSDYNGKRYYFCCGGCPSSFDEDPSKYEDGKALN